MQDRVQLDRVRRDPGLAVVEVEEGHAGHASPRTEPDVVPRDPHLAASKGSRVPVAATVRAPP